MHYLPEIAIVNNVEFDHADIYRDLWEIKYQFSRLMNLVPGNGHLIVGIDSPGRTGSFGRDERETAYEYRNFRHIGRREMAGA